MRLAKAWENIYRKEIRKHVRHNYPKVMFHVFGVDSVELDTGGLNFSIAIIELPDGSICSVPCENVTFLEPLPELKGK